jgi:IS30 family transposase
LTVIWDTMTFLVPCKNKEVTMTYRQITYEERYTLGLLKRQGLNVTAIGRVLGRHRSTIYRELQRNSTNYDGGYRPQLADWYANGRRSKSRRNSRFGPSQWARIQALLQQEWSPEQVAGWLRLHGLLYISHETIYRYVWRDKRHGGYLYKHLRGNTKQRRKRYRSYDSRGRIAGKRSINERPPGAENRTRVGHWETDTVLGNGRPCVLTMVERKTGFLLLGQLHARTTAEVNRRTIHLIRNQPRPVRTITADNGTEFHRYSTVERATHARFYFAAPYHSWERGTNENTNGLLRQYLPKGSSMATLTQHQCNAIANKLNRRPRKRLGYRTPEECYLP